MAAGVRSRARAYALQVLYALDLNDGAAPADAVQSYAGLFELELDDASLAFAHGLVDRTRERLSEIDDAIASASRNWRIERMSRVDRNILRLATCELRGSPDVPVKVIINEAVELAKRFGAGDSAAFVNGILDRIAHQLRRDDPGGGRASGSPAGGDPGGPGA